MNFFLTILAVIFLNTKTHANDNIKQEKYNNDEITKTELSAGKISNNIIDVNVNGMVCDFCAQAIEKVFMKRDEVLGINVNLENQKVIIYLQKESNIEDETLLAIFEDAGYTVDKINRTI